MRLLLGERWQAQPLRHPLIATLMTTPITPPTSIQKPIMLPMLAKPAPLKATAPTMIAVTEMMAKMDARALALIHVLVVTT
jgi:hypothetical protein